jgi:ferredoxin-thioredoxin reductase catalytic subunit
MSDADAFARLSNKYAFDAVVISLTAQDTLDLMPSLYYSPRWVLVYLDPIAAVFVRVMPENEGLIVNERRYGYRACPCRLASGNEQDDTDIVCPCDYRDPDLDEYDACYCALYVSDAVLKGQKKAGSIPERRPPPVERGGKTREKGKKPTDLRLPVWRCRVCGYLCARDQPPEVCPICKAKKDRFERFI